jgi:hypothetical protein
MLPGGADPQEVGRVPDRLFLVERPADIPEVIRRHRDSGETSPPCIVSLSCQASLALEQVGLRYAIPEDFIDLNQFNADALARYRLVGEFCDFLDRSLNARSDLLAHAGLSFGRAHYYALKILFDTVSARIQLAGAVLGHFKPAAVYFAPDHPSPARRDLCFVGRSVYSQILPLVTGEMGVKWTAFEGSPGGTARSSATARCLPIWGLLERAWEAARFRPGLLWDSTIRRLFGIFYSNPPFRAMDARAVRCLFVLNQSHDVPLLVEDIRNQGSWEVVELGNWGMESGPIRHGRASDTVHPELERIWAELVGDCGFRRFFLVDGVDAFPVFEGGLRRFIVQGVAEILAASREYETVYRKHRNGVLITSSTNVGYLGHAAIQTARRCRVPVIMYQEGAGFGVPDCPIYDHTDYQWCDHFMSYGVGTTEHVEGEGITHRASIVPIGSIRLDCLRSLGAGRTRSRKNLMYIPTALHGDVQHYPYNGGTDTYYFEVQKRIVGLCSGFPGVRLYIKGRPSVGGRSSTASVQSAHAIRKNCSLIQYLPLEQVLELGDAYILDFPSTTLLECLTTGKPVFLYLDDFLTKVNGNALRALKKRVVCSESLPELLSQLREYLKHGRYPADVEDMEFLQKYGTYLGDGKSARRACGFLDAVIEPAQNADDARIVQQAFGTAGTRAGNS